MEKNRREETPHDIENGFMVWYGFYTLDDPSLV
jgi:hypothetical protein